MTDIELNPPLTLDDLAETIEQLHAATGRVVRERIAADRARAAAQKIPAAIVDWANETAAGWGEESERTLYFNEDDVDADGCAQVWHEHLHPGDSTRWPEGGHVIGFFTSVHVGNANDEVTWSFTPDQALELAADLIAATAEALDAEAER